jgi:signal transduction histidine kinase
VKILLIYPHSAPLTEFEAFASSRGHELFCHSDVRAARTVLEEGSVDVVVLDMSEDLAPWLPIIESQRERGPSLLLMGNGSEEQVSRALEVGGDAYLTLPVNEPLLALTLNSLLKKSQLLASMRSAETDASRIEEKLKNSQQRQKEAVAEKDLTYRELLLAYSRLQELNQQKNNFLATATHELRTPVTVIKGYHRILLDGRLGELLPQQKEVLLESEQSCSRLIKIINSLLDLSRIEAGKLELIYQDYDVATNVKAIIGQMKSASKRKDLSIVLKLDKDLPRIRCDREKINQVVTNLLENAIKYTPSGGKIYLSAQLYRGKANDSVRFSPSNTELPLSDRSGHASVDSLGQAIMVQVSDTGIGISREDQQQIFQQFTQVSSNQMDRSGLGLGLAISKRIIQAHGGKIWVDSHLDSGSRFTFLLPLSFVEAAAATEIQRGS